MIPALVRLYRRVFGYRCSECSRRCKSQRGLMLHRKTHAAKADDELFEGGES